MKLTSQVPDISVKDAQKNLKKSLEKGILKILSKMGISLLQCYHGAQIFEAYGLGRDVVDTCFKWVVWLAVLFLSYLCRGWRGVA